ncbi:RNA polymerase sigma factor [Pedobacter cryotolerans]|uniref:Sigma-70 family RNA polymerase sigma factor n=1 Tax=Pedobacter cryotolerans TaxID=2571270 RepID=A0A4U1C7Z5_9SPHI|nr:sigma-70 family RNA polymerase sigma factor [Pedobacter cryotolerans]TKB99594.1 sigma-70 family RNA polymerase sigma factor [Pedobacter cryotolerans]
MSEATFLQLLNSNQGIIGKVCSIYCNYKEDYEDLFQEITYQAYKGYPTFRGEAKFSTWLYRIALNTAMSSFRKKKPLLNFVAELPDETIFSDEEQHNQNQHLIYAIKQLNEGDRAIITLYLEELSYAEIASIIGISENNTAVKINRIKNKLHKILSNGK